MPATNVSKETRCIKVCSGEPVSLLVSSVQSLREKKKMRLRNVFKAGTGAPLRHRELNEKLTDSHDPLAGSCVGCAALSNLFSASACLISRAPPSNSPSQTLHGAHFKPLAPSPRSPVSPLSLDHFLCFFFSLSSPLHQLVFLL